MNSRMLQTNLNIGFYAILDLPLRLDLIKFHVYRYFNVNLFVVWCVIMDDLIKLLLYGYGKRAFVFIERI